jgi:hypothetical protein
MKNVKTMAYINLFSILRNIEDLCRLDEKAKALIKDVDLSIGFTIKNGPKAALVFKNGQCKFVQGKIRTTLKLYFTSYEHFNKMMNNQANPIPIKGLSKISFLTGTFTELTNRLEYYLRPDESLLNDEQFKKVHTELLLYTAAFALTQFGNEDPIGKSIAQSIPDGVIAMEVKQGPAIQINIDNGHILTKKGNAESPRARMDFSDMDSAFGLLSGQVDSYTCIASEHLALSGFIPMLENTDKLLFHISAYLR